MTYRRNTNLRRLASAIEKRADFLEDAKNWIVDNPELAAGLLGGAVGAGGGALVPTEDGAGGRVRNALIGALLGGGLGAGAGYLGSDQIRDLLLDKGNDKINPLNTLAGGRDLAWKESVDNMEKDLLAAHPAIPAKAQPIDYDVPDMPDSTLAARDEIGALSTPEDELQDFIDSDAPIKYVPVNAADDARRSLDSSVRTAERAHR